jgi:hypothetical protein
MKRLWKRFLNWLDDEPQPVDPVAEAMKSASVQRRKTNG